MIGFGYVSMMAYEIVGLILVFSVIGSSLATYINGEQEDWGSKLSQPIYISHSDMRGTCPANNYCVPLNSCPMLANLLSQACIRSERITGLNCGNNMICCPSGYAFTSSWYNSQQGQNSASNNNYAPPNGPPNGPPNAPPNMLPHNFDRGCGKPVVQGDNYLGIGAHPWVVRIGFRNSVTGEIKYPCAGSILSRRVILTAAHCALAKADNFKLFSVRAGEWRTDSTLDCGEDFCALPIQDIALSHVIVHPAYEQRIFKNDVALLVLRADINYTVTAQPICIVDAWSQPNNQAILVGWGRTAGQHVPSPLQQTIDLPVVPLQQCINVYSRTIPVTDDHLCAGGQYGNDACEGFGGAPLIVRHNNVYYQTGILSFGSNQCGAAGVPSVYANIKKFAQWIKENTPVIYS